MSQLVLIQWNRIGWGGYIIQLNEYDCDFVRVDNVRSLRVDKKTKQGIAIRALAATRELLRCKESMLQKIRLLVMVYRSALAAGRQVLLLLLFFL